LKQCIGQLPQAQKDSFLLKEEAGLTVKDIVIILNTSFEASKSRLRYAYENPRQCLHVKTGMTMKYMMTIKMNFLFYWPTKKISKLYQNDKKIKLKSQVSKLTLGLWL
jgi:hypothetical protein